MEALKDEEKSESTVSDLDEMWYTGDKDVTYKTLKMKIGMTMKTSKKRQMQMYLMDYTFHMMIWRGCKKVIKGHLHSLRLIRLQHH
jgi:hypothetical protein